MAYPTMFNFSDVNWEVERDIDIAKRKGCSRELVRQKREKLGIACKYKRKDKKLLKWIDDNIHLSGTMTVQEAEEASGRSYMVLKNNGFWKDSSPQNSYRYSRPWDEFNFDLPNKVLGRIWDIKDPPSKLGFGQAAARVRSRSNAGSSKWDFRFGHADEEWLLKNDKEYIAAVKAEEDKYIKWLKKCKDEIEDKIKAIEEDLVLL